MTASLSNISQVKLDIKQIFNNLQKLEEYHLKANLGELKTCTEFLLNKLENLPLEGLKSKVIKRQRKRRNKKLKKVKNLKYDHIADTAESNRLLLDKIAPNSSGPRLKAPHKIVKKCQRFLQTFELLEQLHLERGQNSSESYKFSLKLRQLKSIWNSLLQDKLQEQTSADVKTQQKWNEVLFGPPEKTFFQDKPDLHDFIRKRQIWDTYIDSKYGTPIPIGWILPNADIKEQWQPYSM